MKHVPPMPQPEQKEIAKMTDAELRKEVATLRVFIASLKEQLSDYVDNNRLPDSLNTRIATLEADHAMTRSLADILDRRLHEHTSQAHDLTDIQRTLRTLSSRLDTLERKANKNVS